MDARYAVRGGKMQVKVFTADRLALHLAKGWTAEQLTSGRVAVLGAKTTVVKCARGARVVDLKKAVEDAMGVDSDACSVMNGRRVMTADEPVFEGTVYLLLRDEPAPAAPAAEPEEPGSLRLRDPQRCGGSRTVTTTVEEEDARAAAARRAKVEEAQQLPPEAYRDVDRRDMLRALARRHGR
eukprot:TRINITY_DN1985_c0_g6_i1.p1 TRINITY_DN1985_c0_g6~~TRINITY_DN1985_c0_g6_i1.p1  ORF type:complete len:182 (+),score=53.24 TRINITY_DN1985_c0_g6_i1:87-632(+)